MLKWLSSLFASAPNETVLATATEPVLTPHEWVTKWARANGSARVEQNESGARYVRASFDLEGQPCRLVVYEFETGVHNVWLETPLPKAYGDFALMRFDVGDPPVAEEVDPDDDEIEPEQILFVSETTYLASSDSDAELARLLSIPEAEREKLIALAERYEAVTLSDQCLQVNLGAFPAVVDERGAPNADGDSWPLSEARELLAIGASVPRLKKKDAVSARAAACTFCGALTRYRPEKPVCCRCGAPMQADGGSTSAPTKGPKERKRGLVYGAESRAQTWEHVRATGAKIAAHIGATNVRESEPALTVFADARASDRNVTIEINDVCISVRTSVPKAVGEFFIAHFDGDEAPARTASTTDLHDAHDAWRDRESPVWFGKHCQIFADDTEADVERFLSIPEGVRERVVGFLDSVPHTHLGLEEEHLTLGLSSSSRESDLASLDAAIALALDVASTLPLDCESADAKRLPLQDCDHCGARSFVSPRTKDCFACGAPLAA